MSIYEIYHCIDTNNENILDHLAGDHDYNDLTCDDFGYYEGSLLYAIDSNNEKMVQVLKDRGANFKKYISYPICDLQKLKKFVKYGYNVNDLFESEDIFFDSTENLFELKKKANEILIYIANNIEKQHLKMLYESINDYNEYTQDNDGDFEESLEHVKYLQ